jgi:hypothetical protein
VAIGAILADIRKNRLHVAAGARYFFVHAAQGISRGVVIEFRDSTDGSPGCGRVTILAGDVEGAVRTLPRLPLCRCGQSDCDHKKYPEPTGGVHNSQGKVCPHK